MGSIKRLKMTIFSLTLELTDFFLLEQMLRPYLSNLSKLTLAMTTSIVLTAELRSLPYFSDLCEEVVEVPARPFLRELLNKTLKLEQLSLPELFSCLETSIYFTLDTSQLTREIVWNLSIDKKTFHRYGQAQSIISKSRLWLREEVWSFGGELPALVKAELDRNFGVFLTKEQLLALGVRGLRATSAEIIAQGNLRLLKWAHAKALDQSFWIPEACEKAAKRGDLGCLQYAHENGCEWDEYTLIAAVGNLPCLRYCHENKCPYEDPFIKNICGVAAEMGSLECLQYLHEQGYPWIDYMPGEDVDPCSLAAKNGHLECLKYARSKGCPWSTRKVYKAAVEGGHEACINHMAEAVKARQKAKARKQAP